MSTIQQFDFSVDLLRALLWQYNDAERLQKLLELKQDWYNDNQRDFWQNWERDVFDLRTANDFGLSVWSIILNVPLVADEGTDPIGKPIWGFGAYRQNFNNGNFAKTGSGSVKLTMAQKRLVLQLRYFQLVSRGTIPEINGFLKALWGNEGQVYVIDSYDMTFAIYVFTFSPSSQVQFILEKFDLLPRPAGVGVKYLVITKNTWGFGEFHQNFNNGNFVAEV